MSKMLLSMLKKFEKIVTNQNQIVFAIVMLIILCGYIMKYRNINKHLTTLDIIAKG